MAEFKRFVPRVGAKARLGLGAAALLALGAAGGAGAVQATRPAVEMAPRVAVPIASLAQRDGLVTVKGRVAEVYGDHFVVADGSGRAMVAAGREARGTVTAGQPVLVQGRYDDGQLRASYLVQPNGTVEAVGPAGPHPRREGPDKPGHDGPPPPPGGPAASCAPAGGPGAPPPPPPGPGRPVPPPPANGKPPAPIAALAPAPRT